jgi:CheY-like chemotaxis protein
MTAPMIALLDNDPSFLSILHELLADEGYRTVRCRPDDVLSAHAPLKLMRPALVMLQLWLAERDGGWAFLEHLWGDAETTQIPALVDTAGLPLPPAQAAGSRRPPAGDGIRRSVGARRRRHPRRCGGRGGWMTIFSTPSFSPVRRSPSSHASPFR